MRSTYFVLLLLNAVNHNIAQEVDQLSLRKTTNVQDTIYKSIYCLEQKELNDSIKSSKVVIGLPAETLDVFGKEITCNDYVNSNGCFIPLKIYEKYRDRKFCDKTNAHSITIKHLDCDPRFGKINGHLISNNKSLLDFHSVNGEEIDSIWEISDMAYTINDSDIQQTHFISDLPLSIHISDLKGGSRNNHLGINWMYQLSKFGGTPSQYLLDCEELNNGQIKSNDNILNLNVYPNIVATGTFYISYAGVKEQVLKYELCDLTGNTLMKNTILSNGTHEAYIGNFPPGVYLIKFYTNQEVLQIIKLIKI